MFYNQNRIKLETNIMLKDLAYAMVRKEIKCIQPGKEKIKQSLQIYK